MVGKSLTLLVSFTQITWWVTKYSRLCGCSKVSLFKLSTFVLRRFEEIKAYLISRGINEYLIGLNKDSPKKGLGDGFQYRAYEGF